VNWSTDQVAHGRCAMCGARALCTEQPVSDDADLLYRIARAESQRRDTYAHFERYLSAGSPSRSAA
jgi:hypothetical protein